MLNKNDFLYDKRLTERFVLDGHLTRKTHNRFLASLPDTADKAEPILSPDQAEEEAEAPANETSEATPETNAG